MPNDLLAPPKLKPRTFAIVSGVVVGVPIAGGCALAASRIKPPWEFAWQAALALALWAAVAKVYGRIFRRVASIRPERMPFVHAGVALGPMAVFVVALKLMLQGTALTNSVQGMYFMLPCMLGGMLVQGGWARRVGDSRHCPKCDYEFTFTDAEAPIRCPECATPWLGRLIQGRKVKSRKMMGVGTAIVLLGFLIMTPILWLSPLAPHLPTPILYAALYADPAMFTASQELARRPLSEHWVKVMARRVISTSNANQWSFGGSTWFRAMIAAGTMPADMIELANREAFRADVIVPRRVKAGEPFPAYLRVRRAVDGAAGQLGVMFAGYSVNGGPALGKFPETVFAYNLRPGFLSGPRQQFEQTLTLPAGKNTITTTYWVIMQPSFWPITWGDDGAPVKPAAATWFDKVEVTVEVEAR